MFRASFKFASLIFAFGLTSVLTVKAQVNVCDLQLKVSSYNAIPSKSFLKNVEVVLKNLKTKEEKLLNISSTASIFENLAEGSYRIKLSKKGYKDRKKETKVECGFADKNGVFSVNIYLWEDKSVPADESNLQENIVETITNDKTESISQSEISDDKSVQGKTKKVSGKVTVRVTIDTDGNVVSAKAANGDSLLADAAVKSARQSKFTPTILAGIPVDVTGDIIYNFIP